MAQSSPAPLPSRSGPWGDTFLFDDGFYSAVRGFKIYYDDQGVNGLQLDYVRKDDVLVVSQLHGSATGTPFETQFATGTYLSYIDGLYAEDKVNSLTFHTSTSQAYGPYGTQSGSTFSSPKTGTSSPTNVAKVTGFFGRAGQVLKAVGVAYY